jgi:hypothetical protein
MSRLYQELGSVEAFVSDFLQRRMASPEDLPALNFFVREGGISGEPLAHPNVVPVPESGLISLLVAARRTRQRANAAASSS